MGGNGFLEFGMGCLLEKALFQFVHRPVAEEMHLLTAFYTLESDA